MHTFINENEDSNPYSHSELKGKAYITNPQMEKEYVPVEEADKYKDFIAKKWDEMCERNPEMRNTPNEYLSV